MTEQNLQALYRHRFTQEELPRKNAIWQVLCRHYFQRHVDAGKDVVLDLACGYGEFINNIRARRKIAIDLNPDSPAAVGANVEFHATRADQLHMIESDSVDVVFTSNFFEHLPDKAALTTVLNEVHRVLRPGGKLIAMGPNIRCVPGAYWDFIDHHIALSERSLGEALSQTGFDVVESIDRFLPYTTQSRLPQGASIVRAYLMLPLAWRFFGKQFLVVSTKPL